MSEADWQKRYLSLVQRVEALERENTMLHLQLGVYESQARSHEVARVDQASIVQDHIGRLNAQLQEERQEIERLRAMLRERADAD